MSDKYLETLDELKKIVDDRRKEGYLIATTNGRFAPFHLGQGYMLEAAKLLIENQSEEKSKQGGILIVLLNSDYSVQKLNGLSKHCPPQEERAGTLALLKCVDYITPFDEVTPLKYLEELKPDMHIKGRGKSTLQQRIDEEIKILGNWGGQHEVLSLLEGFSTARILERFQNMK